MVTSYFTLCESSYYMLLIHFLAIIIIHGPKSLAFFNYLIDSVGSRPMSRNWRGVCRLSWFFYLHVDFVGPQVMQCDRPNTDKDGFIYTNQPEEYINWKVCTYSIINFSTVYREGTGNCETEELLESEGNYSSHKISHFLLLSLPINVILCLTNRPMPKLQQYWTWKIGCKVFSIDLCGNDVNVFFVKVCLYRLCYLLGNLSFSFSANQCSLVFGCLYDPAHTNWWLPWSKISRHVFVLDSQK